MSPASTGILPSPQPHRVLQGPAGRIPELDGIRGIAIGMVILYHYIFLTIASRPASPLSYALTIGRLSWSGVDLFFVLSGFLIGGILLDARHSSNYFRAFYVRRFYRIVPLYALWFCFVLLIVTVIRAGVAPGLSWFLKDHLPMYPYVFFLQNFWMAAHNNLGGISSGGTWSLAIEEQFYLTLPMIIRFYDLVRAPWLVVMGVVSAPALRVLLYHLSPHNSVTRFALMPCRADALLLGVLAAILIRDRVWKERIEKNPRVLQLLLGIFLAGAAYLTVRNRDMSSFLMTSIGYTWLAGLYACFLLYAVTQPQSRLSSFLRWRYLRWLGMIAYGVYLAHGYVIALLYSVFGLEATTDSITKFFAAIGAFLLTVLLCTISWNYFEKPLMRIGHRAKY